MNEENQSLDGFSLVFCRKVVRDDGEKGVWTLVTTPICGTCDSIDLCKVSQPILPKESDLYLSASRVGVVKIGKFTFDKDGIEFDLDTGKSNKNAKEDIY